MKECTKCGQVKPVSEFYANKSVKSGLRPDCKECTKARSAAHYQQNRAKADQRSRAYREAHPEYYKNYYLWRCYRLTPDEYAAKLAEQNGGCAICGGHPLKGKLAVDHDHSCCPGEKSCGKCVRGLLCRPCNTGVGLIDNPDWLRRRADYLDTWKGLKAPAS